MDRLPGLKHSTLVLLTLLVAVTPALAHGWESCEGWEENSDWGGKGRYCEVRTLNLPATGSVAVDAGHNGGIAVTGSARDDIEVEARIGVWHRSEEGAREIAGKITISTDGNRVTADTGGEDDWAVSYRLRVPHETDLELAAHNGGISIEKVYGKMRAETHNGGISLTALAGDVRAETTNGGLDIELVGDQWDGEGLDAETRNGGVQVLIPADYSAELETGTVNGRIDIDFPVTVQGRIGRDIETTLGSGGAPIRIKTRNGGVSIRQN